MILEYFKRLLTKWFAYLFFLPDLIDLIQANLNYTIPISSNILNIFALIALFYGTYQVWNDMRLEKLELEEKLKNPIDYEVKAKIKKVKIDLDYIEKSINENIEKTESLISSASQELEKLSSNDDIDQRIQMVNEARQYLSSKSSQSEIIYKMDLRSYIESLKSYHDKKDSFLLEWKSFNDNKLKDIYFVNFYITNTGRQFDEDIDIKIHFNNENKHIGRIRSLDNFPKSFALPSKPEKQKSDIESLLQRPFDTLEFARSLNPQINNQQNEKMQEDILCTNRKSLKPLNKTRIFVNNGYFIKIINKNDIDIFISSNYYSSKINKKLVYEDCGEFDYFKDF